MSSPREREKRDSRGDEREGLGRKRNRSEIEETEEIKRFPSILNCYKESRPCPTISQYQLDAPGTHSPHPTTSDLERSNGGERTESKCRKDEDHESSVVRAWTS